MKEANYTHDYEYLVKIFIALGFHGYQKNNNNYLYYLLVHGSCTCSAATKLISYMIVLIGKYYERSQ